MGRLRLTRFTSRAARSALTRFTREPRRNKLLRFSFFFAAATVASKNFVAASALSCVLTVGLPGL